MEDINRKIVLELELNDNDFKFISSIGEAKREAKKELDEINKSIIDNEDTIRMLTPECDKIDYILALCSGTICGIIDVFLVAKPGESLLQNKTDKWFEDKTRDFAKLCGWKSENNTTESAIRYL